MRTVRWILAVGLLALGVMEALRSVAPVERNPVSIQATIALPMGRGENTALLPQPRDGQWAVSDSAPKETDPVKAALEYIEEHRETWNIRSHHELRPSLTSSPLGAAVRFDVLQDGLAVSGLSITIHLGRNNEVRSVDNMYRPLEPTDLSQSMLTAEEAAGLVGERYLASEDGAEPGMVLYANPSAQSPEPAYSMSMVELSNGGATRRPVSLLVRASDGQILDIAYARTEFPLR